VFVVGGMKPLISEDIHHEEENRGGPGPQQRNILPACPHGNSCGKTAQTGAGT
jgi:hypothetical protein